MDRVLLVVEANNNRHIVIDRIVATIAMVGASPQIRILVLVNSDTTDTLPENPAMYRDLQWFENLTRPLDLLEVDYDVVVSWSTHFAASIIHAAREFKAVGIGVPVYDELTDGELTMLRDAPCPVFFNRPGGSPVMRKAVLAAVRPVEDEDGRPELNETLLEAARTTAGRYDAALHLAYVSGKEDWTAQQIADAAGVEADQVHIADGPPDEAIQGIIEDTGADLLVLGTRRRQQSQSLRGGVIDRLLSSVSIDVLVTP